MGTVIAVVISLVFFLMAVAAFFKTEETVLVETESNTPEAFMLTLASIGDYYMPLKEKLVNLGQYFIDKEGNLYSTNPLTWEVNPKDKRDILVCSDKAGDAEGNIINSLKAPNGQKVTIRRNSLNFNTLAQENGTITATVIKTTDRHLKVLGRHSA